MLRSIRKNLILIALSLIGGASAPVFAANQCAAVFSDGASAYTNGGKITFEWNSQIKESPDGILDIPDIEDKTGNNHASCNNQDCTSSGNYAAGISLPTFQDSSNQSNNITVSSNQTLSDGDYGDITVKENKKLTLSSTGVYKIKSLTIEYKGQVKFEAGTFWIDQLTVKEEGQFRYDGDSDATAVVYTKNLVVEYKGKVNKKNGRDAGNLLLLNYGDATFKEQSKTEAFLFSANKATFEYNSKLEGAVNSEIILLKENVEIKYKDDNLDDLIDGGICGGASTPLPDPIAHWSADLCDVDGTSGELVDVINGFNGSTVDGADIEESARYCQGLRFDGVDSHANIPHQNAFELAEGTVSFWINADDVDYNYRSGRGGQGLFSKDSSHRDNGSDHLTIWLDANEEIFVRHQVGNSDNNIQGDTSLVSGQWYHIAYSWGNAGMRLYINGDLDKSVSASGDINTNPEPIILGANAWVTGNNQSESHLLKDMFKGVMDDIKLFDKQLTDDNVEELYGLDTYTCQDCVKPEPELVGHWKANICSLNGTEGEVIDAINGNNGQSVDGATIDSNGKFCQALNFDGIDSNVIIPHDEDFALENGSISFWFKVDDLSHSHDGQHGGQGIFSKDSSGWDHGGEHITMWVRSNGSIRVRHQLLNGNNSSDLNIEAASNTVQENTWHHLVYTWGEDGAALYVDNSLKDSDNDTRDISGNPEPIILGANAWTTSNYSSPSSQLRDKFKGEMDDIRLYEGQLDASDVNNLYTETNQDQCTDCTILISHWPMDVCELNGQNEIVDIVSGYNGVGVNGLDIDTDGRLCQAGEFSGDEAHISIQDNDYFETQAGAVAFWFNADDLTYVENENHGGQTLFAKGNIHGDDFLAVWLNNDGTVEVEHSIDGTLGELVTDSAVASANNWYHLMYSFGSNGMSLYINGQLVKQNANFTGGTDGISDNILLGAHFSQGDDDAGSCPHFDHEDWNGQYNGNGHTHHGHHHFYLRGGWWGNDDWDDWWDDDWDDWWDDDDWNDGDDDDHDEAGYKDIFKGTIDDVRFYITGQPGADVANTLFTMSESNCDNCVVEEPELVAHYTSDVCSINGDGGSYVDIINANNGTFIDGVINTTGKFCNAAQFGGDDEHINIPHTQDFEIAEGAVSMWVYVNDLEHDDDSGYGQAVFSKDSAGLDNNAGHLTIWIQDDGDVKVRHQIDSQHDLKSSGDPITENTWHHIAYTWGSDGKRLYVDGVLKDTESGSGGIQSNPEPIILAANAWYTGNSVSSPSDLDDFFKGKLDDVRIYGNEQPDDDFIEDLFEENYQCTQCSNALAHYKFEESSWGGTGSVIDSAGNFNGTNVSISAPIDPVNPISCRALNVPWNDTEEVINAIDTGINPKNHIGNQGTISFWYRSNENWNSGNPRVLFDASNYEDSDDEIFFYAEIDTSGDIEFGFEDDDDRNVKFETTGGTNKSAGSWHHIAITWDLDAEDVNIYVDGNSLSMSGSFPSGFDNSFGDMLSLYIGDNRSDYDPEHTDNSANGEIDDFRVYAYVQTRTEIQNDAAEVTECEQTVHHYELIYDTPASICSTSIMTVRACADEACSSLVSGNQTVDIDYLFNSTITKVKADLVLTNGEGQTPYTLPLAQTGNLRVSDQNPTASNGYTCSQENCEVTFDYVLEINVGGQDVDIGTQIGEAIFSSGSSAVSVKAPQGCPLLDPDATVPLQVAVECVNPAACSGASFEIFKNQTGYVSLTATESGQPLNYVTVKNNFNGSETSLTNMVYNDVGEIRLHVRAGGSSDSTQFVVKPSYLALDSTADNFDTHTSATNFGLSVVAHGDNGGVMQSYQPGSLEFSYERIAPNSVGAANANLSIDYGTDAETPMSLVDNSNITSFNAFSDSQRQPVFTNGSSESITANIDEVGRYAIDVQDSDYQSVGLIQSYPYVKQQAPVTVENMFIGRFIPAYFEAEIGFDFKPYDSSANFVYRGDELEMNSGHKLTFTAKNANEETTKYYDADVANYFYYNQGNNFVGRAYSEEEAGETITSNFTPEATFLNESAGDGKFSFVLANDTVIFNKKASPSLPRLTGDDEGELEVTLTIPMGNLLDNDGVGVKVDMQTSGFIDFVSAPAVDGIEIREGRFALQNITNTESEDLLVTMIAEFWYSADGNAANAEWVISKGDNGESDNSADGTTPYDSVYLKLISGDGSISTNGSGLNITKGSTPNGGDNAMTITFTPTDSEDEEKVIEFTIEYDIPADLSFLEYAWGNSQRNPYAKITIGVSRGNDRIIHWREVF